MRPVATIFWARVERWEDVDHASGKPEWPVTGSRRSGLAALLGRAFQVKNQ
ncbi:MAG TPA: hypothetical protein VHX68_02320 [Planctomycetaceae bacterium]|nr:hypothetical protein [Planctomycetaceae bacterium]